MSIGVVKRFSQYDNFRYMMANMPNAAWTIDYDENQQEKYCTYGYVILKFEMLEWVKETQDKDALVALLKEQIEPGKNLHRLLLAKFSIKRPSPDSCPVPTFGSKKDNTDIQLYDVSASITETGFVRLAFEIRCRVTALTLSSLTKSYTIPSYLQYIWAFACSKPGFLCKNNELLWLPSSYENGAMEAQLPASIEWIFQKEESKRFFKNNVEADCLRELENAQKAGFPRGGRLEYETPYLIWCPAKLKKKSCYIQ